MRSAHVTSLLAVALMVSSCVLNERETTPSAPSQEAGRSSWMLPVSSEVLPEGACGPLSAGEPAYTPFHGAAFQHARRIDVALRAGASEWCLAGVRVYDRGAELVGRDRGRPPGTDVVWGAAQLDLGATGIIATTDARVPAGGPETVVRPGGVRSLNLPAPMFWSRDHWLTEFSQVRAITLSATLVRALEGPWVFPPVPIADGPIDVAAEAQRVTLRLQDLRRWGGTSIAVAYAKLAEMQNPYFAPYSVNFEWDPARDDLGNAYHPRGSGHLESPWLYEFFDPAPPSNARAIQFTVRRLFERTEAEWKVTLTLRR